MLRLQGFKFRLKVRKQSVEQQLTKTAGCCRYVYNRVLAINKERYAAGEKKLSYVESAALITKWKREPETVWLCEVAANPLQQSLRDLDRAYVNFFAKRAMLPRFKRLGMGDSFRHPKGVKLDQANGRVYLPRIGWLKYFNSQSVLGKLKNTTVSKRNEHWYVSFQTEREVDESIHPASGSVGIDLGIVNFATLSDGTVVKPANALKGKLKRLARLQRVMSRRKKDSANCKKAKQRVAKLYTKIANVRLDHLHKASTDISKKHATIVIEDLKVANMSASAKGTVDQPGQNVRAKSGLNRAILDQGWFEFRRQLEYKQAWRGGRVVVINPKNTSRKCPRCGHVAKKNRPTQSKFRCVKCMFSGNADAIAAQNILAAGQAVIACGDGSLDLPVKQEPTSAKGAGVLGL